LLLKGNCLPPQRRATIFPASPPVIRLKSAGPTNPTGALRSPRLLSKRLPVTVRLLFVAARPPPRTVPAPHRPTTSDGCRAPGFRPVQLVRGKITGGHHDICDANFVDDGSPAPRGPPANFPAFPAGCFPAPPPPDVAAFSGERGVGDRHGVLSSCWKLPVTMKYDTPPAERPPPRHPPSQTWGERVVVPEAPPVPEVIVLLVTATVRDGYGPATAATGRKSHRPALPNPRPQRPPAPFEDPGCPLSPPWPPRPADRLVGLAGHGAHRTFP